MHKKIACLLKKKLIAKAKYTKTAKQADEIRMLTRNMMATRRKQGTAKPLRYASEEKNNDGQGDELITQPRPLARRASRERMLNQE